MQYNIIRRLINLAVLTLVMIYVIQSYGFWIPTLIWVTCLGIAALSLWIWNKFDYETKPEGKMILLLTSDYSPLVWIVRLIFPEDDEASKDFDDLLYPRWMWFFVIIDIFLLCCILIVATPFMWAAFWIDAERYPPFKVP
ncbi:MAG: hypothetical protein RL094_664 [Candidatus Parcubacteria bacterium]|jgi:hypothetical protein